MLHDDDAVLNTAGDRPFSEVAAARLNRREVIGGGLAAAAAFFAGPALLGGVAAAGPGATTLTRTSGLGFEAIPIGYDDEVRVPPGYTVTPFIPWGTPILGSMPGFIPGTPPLVPGGNSAVQQAEQIGMHHDGMHYFPLERGPGGNERGLLVVNHEYTDEGYLHTGTTTVPDRATWTLEMQRPLRRRRRPQLLGHQRQPVRGHPWGTERAPPLRMGGGARPVRATVDPVEAHGPGPDEARGGVRP